MRTALPLALLLVLALFAGCSGTLGGDTGTSTDANRPMADLPPGLNESSVTNVSALAAAHAESLDGESVAVTVNHTLTAGNGTALFDLRRVQRVAANHSRIGASVSYDGTYPSAVYETARDIEAWHTRAGRNAVRYSRLVGPNGSVRYDDFGLGGYESDPVDERVLAGHYREATSVTVTREDERLRLELTRPTDRIRFPRMPAVNVSEEVVTVTMTPDGRVTEYRAEYSGRLVDSPETTVEGVRTVTFGDVGGTTLDRPDWLPAARNATAPPTPGAGTGTGTPASA
jgi:hypothetical protein